jgi:hypothetical protein
VVRGLDATCWKGQQPTTCVVVSEAIQQRLAVVLQVAEQTPETRPNRATLAFLDGRR